MKHSYTLTFRGETVASFTSVYDVQAVRLGYRRAPDGTVSSRPAMLDRMKTIRALVRASVPAEWRTYPGQTFVVMARPGTTEITEFEAWSA